MSNFHPKFFTIIFTVFVACASSIPKPTTNNPSKNIAIGISITERALIRAITFNPDWVYFIKVEHDSDFYTQSELIKSNYAKGSHVYLLNAEPGNYAVVASGRQIKPDEVCLIFYSQEMIEQTKITTVDGEMVFMGDFVIDLGAGLNSIQKHYYEQWKRFKRSSGFLGTDTRYSGKIYISQQDEVARNNFLSQAAQNFEKAPQWLSVIEKSKSR